MPQPDIAIPSRAPAEVSADDTVQPFEVSALDLRGRVVRLGPAVDTILSGHDYPQPVAKLLGEAIVLGVLLGTALKFEGRFILQTKTDACWSSISPRRTGCGPARGSTDRRLLKRLPRDAPTPARCSGAAISR
jgi:hypothetical protein